MFHQNIPNNYIQTFRQAQHIHFAILPVALPSLFLVFWPQPPTG